MTELQQLKLHAGEASGLLKELSNPNRLLICCMLAEGEMSVSELNDKIGLSQSALSQHLARLREAELVSTRKDRQTVYYMLKGAGVDAVIGALKSIYCP